MDVKPAVLSRTFNRAVFARLEFYNFFLIVVLPDVAASADCVLLGSLFVAFSVVLMVAYELFACQYIFLVLLASLMKVNIQKPEKRKKMFDWCVSLKLCVRNAEKLFSKLYMQNNPKIWVCRLLKGVHINHVSPFISCIGCICQICTDTLVNDNSSKISERSLPDAANLFRYFDP